MVAAQQTEESLFLPAPRGEVARVFA